MEMGTIYGTEMGIMPGDDPFLTRTLGEALCKLREMKHVSLVLERGEYHFYPQYGTKGKFWISNHHKCADLILKIMTAFPRNIIYSGYPLFPS